MLSPAYYWCTCQWTPSMNRFLGCCWDHCNLDIFVWPESITFTHFLEHVAEHVHRFHVNNSMGEMKISRLWNWNGSSSSPISSLQRRFTFWPSIPLRPISDSLYYSAQNNPQTGFVWTTLIHKHLKNSNVNSFTNIK